MSLTKETTLTRIVVIATDDNKKKNNTTFAFMLFAIASKVLKMIK